MRSVLQNEDPTKDLATNLKWAALLSFIIVLPFVILESLNNTISRQNAFGLFLLFGFLWLLPMVFIAIIRPLVRTVRAGKSVMANPINLLLRVAFLALIAMTWGSLLIDQIPCFLGVPNCD